MDYSEFPPPADLRRHLDCVWVLRDDTPHEGVQTVFPDGRCEIIVHFAEPMRLLQLDGTAIRQSAQLFAGQVRGPVRLHAQGAVHCLGARLTPTASALLVGRQLPQLRDCIPDLHVAAPAAATGFVAAAAAFALRGDHRVLWQWLRDRCPDDSIDAGIEAAIHAIDAADGMLRMDSLPGIAHTGTRSFQQRFLAVVGLTAKEYARIRRLQATLRTLDSEATSFADVAAQHGYFDQAHATREFMRLTGFTPARLSRALRDQRESDASLHMAAAFVRGHSTRL